MRTKMFLPVLFAVAVASAVAIGVGHVDKHADEELPPSNVEQQLPPTVIYGIKGPITFPEIVLGEGVVLPEAPDKVMVYKVKSPEVTAEKVIALADTLGLSGSISEHDYPGSSEFIVRDNSLELRVVKASGRISYMDLSRAHGDINNPPNLPPDEDAINSAEKFLRDKGLMPEDAGFSEVVTDFTELLTKDPDTGMVSIKKIAMNKQVRFSRKMINGFPVIGKSSKLKVHIGDNGDVVGFYKYWREYEPFKLAVILSPSQALKILEERSGVHVTLTERVTVKEMYLAYYTLGAADVQEYLQPVYVFEIDTGRVIITGRYILTETIPAILQEKSFYPL